MSVRMVSAQVRGARGMLGWSMVNLARAAGVSVSTVKRMEAGGPQPCSNSTCAAVRTALETAGVSFLDDEGDGWGLRLRS